MKYAYRAFGLTIASDFALPELPKALNGEPSDIVICKGNLTGLWQAFVKEQGPDKFAVKDQEVMFKVSDAGIFYIAEGKTILISLADGADAAKVRLYILGTCMGILLMQRKILPLHGSTIAIDGKAYVFSGRSGIGKSTLAAALINKGYRLLSDDLAPISFDTAQLPIAGSSYPQQKLWQDSLRQLCMDPDQYDPLFRREKKFAVPVCSQFHMRSLPLAGVIELSESAHKGIELKPIRGLERLQLLYRNTYRSSLIPQLGLMKWHFLASTNIASAIRMYGVKRPSDGFNIELLASLIVDKLIKGG